MLFFRLNLLIPLLIQIENTDMKNFVFVLMLILVAVASALFFSQNDDIVVINYFGSSIDLQMNWILIGMLIFGFCLGVLSMMTNLVSMRLRLASANKNIKNNKKGRQI